MNKRIRNTITYLFFLGVGVLLFYLATLDITRGSLAIESSETQFEVGRGMGPCSYEGESEARVLRIPEVNEAFAQSQMSIVNKESGASKALPLSPQKEAVEFCLPEGSYTLQITDFPAGQTLVIEGVDKTETLKNDMRQAKVPGILLSFLMGYLAIVSRGLRWIILLEPLGYKPNKWRSVHAVAFAYFANTFVPRSGEVARCVALNQTDGVPVDRLFGTVISERVVDFIMLVGITSVAIMLNLEAFNALLIGSGSNSEGESSYNLFLYLVIVLGLGVALLFFLRRSVLLGAVYQKIVGILKGVGEGLKTVLTMRRKGAFIAHTFFIWLMYFLMAFVIYKSIEASSHLTFSQALFIMVAGGFGMVIPAPGGIGSYHWMVKLAFIALGLSGTVGFVVANVLWLTQTVMMIIGGGIGYLVLMWFRIKRDRKQKIHEEA